MESSNEPVSCELIHPGVKNLFDFDFICIIIFYSLAVVYLIVCLFLSWLLLLVSVFNTVTDL